MLFITVLTWRKIEVMKYSSNFKFDFVMRREIKLM